MFSWSSVLPILGISEDILMLSTIAPPGDQWRFNSWEWDVDINSSWLHCPSIFVLFLFQKKQYFDQMRLARENYQIIIMHVRTRKNLALNMGTMNLDTMQLKKIDNQLTIENSVTKLGPTQTYAIRRNMQLSDMHIAGVDCIYIIYIYIYI